MRKFLTILFLIVPLAASAQERHELERKIAVSSYAWKNLTLEKMFADLKTINVHEVGLFQNAVLSDEDPIKFSHNATAEERARFKKLFEKYGIKIVSYMHIRTPNPDEIRKVFEFAREFGIPALSVEAPPESLKYYDEFAGEYGVRVGLYNHSIHSKGAPYTTPEKMLAAMEGFKNIQAFPDNGHFARSGFDEAAQMRKLEGRILCVSFQDVEKEGGDCAVYGTGKCGLDSLLAELDRQRLRGYYLVMFSAKDEPLKYVAPCVEYLRARPIVLTLKN